MPAVFLRIRSIIYVRKMNHGAESRTALGSEPDINFFKGQEIKIIRQNFTYLLETMEDTLFRKVQDIVAQHQPANLNRLNGLSNGKLKTLLSLMLTNNDACSHYFEEIKRCQQQDVIRVLASTEEKTADSQFDNKAKHQITKQELVSKREYLVDIELNRSLNLFFEYGVITINEFIGIITISLREQQREALINMLFQKESLEWVPRFIYVLKIAGEDNFLTSLKGQEVGKEDTSNDMYAVPNNGHTERYVAHVPVDVDPGALREPQDNAQRELGCTVSDMWSGCIYLWLTSGSLAELQSLLRQSKNEKIARFLNNIFCTEKAQRSIAGKEFVTFEIEKVSDDQFLDKKYYGRKFAVKTYQECARCIKEQIVSHWKDIAGEIETDIIEETFQKLSDASSFIQDDCLNKKKTIQRKARALKFLNYIIAREESLIAFIEVFKRKSRMEIVLPDCIHDNKLLTKTATGKDQKVIFTFKVERENGFLNFVPVEYQKVDQEAEDETDININVSIRKRYERSNTFPITERRGRKNSNSDDTYKLIQLASKVAQQEEQISRLSKTVEQLLVEKSQC